MKKKTVKLSKRARDMAQRAKAAYVGGASCRIEHGWERDGNGDITGWTDCRCLIKAKLVEGDFTLVLDMAKEDKKTWLHGLSFHSFMGITSGEEHDCGDEWAFFDNGRVLPVISIGVAPLSDPAEITARELKHARLRGDKQGTTAPKRVTNAQHDRNKKGGEAKFQLSERDLAVIKKEWDFLGTLPKSRRGTIIAARCKNGEWKHNDRMKSVIKRRDGIAITWRYICDVVARTEQPKKRKR